MAGLLYGMNGGTQGLFLTAEDFAFADDADADVLLSLCKNSRFTTVFLISKLHNPIEAEANKLFGSE